MSAPDHPHQIEIPESLRRQLADFRRHLWQVKIQEALAAGLIGLLVSFLLVYGLDRIWQTPGWARLLILLGGMSLFAGFAPYWLHRWVWKQRRETQLARLIAKRYPGLGDRLLGVIELQDQQGSADSLSPRLREAAMEAVAAETGRRKLEDALPPQKHRRWALAAMLLAAVSATAFTLTPRAGLNALQRWLLPLSNTERYTFTKLENPPSHRAVAFGEAFVVVLKLAADSEQRPSEASGRYGLQPAVTTTLDGNSYHFTFPGQQDPGVIVFRIGDLRHEMRIEPVQRPSTKAVRAVVTPPAYLGIAERSVDLNSGVLSVVEGGKLRIELEMNRPLESGSFGPTRSLALEEGGEETTHTPAAGDLTVSGGLASTPVLDVGAVPFEIPFTWKDRFGLEGDTGFRLRVEALKDAAPTCYLQGIDRQKVMLPEETIDFEVLAEDDFGVKAAGIEWSGQFTRPTDESPAKGELLLGEGAPEERRLLKAAAFSPAAFGISPQKITLRGFTEDHFPERARVYSEPVVLYVLTRDEHAQMLKNLFDRQITELEDLARRELGLLEENERLEKLDGSELQQDENRKRLEEQTREEAESERRMEELKQRMEQLMKDAARNGDIDKKTLQKMAESLKSMQELAEQDIPKVAEKLAESQEQSNTPEKSEQDVEQAVEQQKKVVEKMQEAIDKANDANRRFEAGTFVNRLKKAANEQNGIVASLKEAFERLLGLKTPALDPSDTRRLNENARQQMETAADVRWIQEDLGHYYARTKTESFKQIMDEMRGSGIDIGLENIRTRLADNHSYEAAEAAKKWADQLAAWAAKLEGDKDSGGGGGGSGGAPDAEDEDFEFMLRVMKMIQQEQDLRARTRVLEQLRRDQENQTEEPTGP
ncbi:MAG: hypothetical protein EHM17_00535 [Verrucomicrobiaceae bacterium]|nr:MAG: hypothetical protein EHM17_00535 [Verrucomicrobiaceae bacterium]